MEIYKIGSKGEMVKQIQKALHLIDDGIYGKITEEAVKTFQKENGLKADGIVGPATLAKMLPCRFKKSKRSINLILVHCTATPEGKNFTVDDIRRWHTTPVAKGGRGWSDIGYHYVIDTKGRCLEGRDVNLVGAHCEGYNAHSIGIVYVGGLDKDGKTPKDTRTLTQKAALLNLLAELRRLYPTAKIAGHRDYNKKGKACPCFDAKTEYKDI